MSANIQGAAESRLWRWLKSVAPYPAALAWCHTTDVFELRKFIESGWLSPEVCPVFKEDLLYFFYGRPAYRRSQHDQLLTSAIWPVVIILRPELLLQGKRLYPFDTGAFEDKLYQRWMHRRMKMTDFELECPSDAPQRHVTSFFKNNSNYLRLKAQEPLVPYKGELEVDALANLLTDSNIGNADDRRIAVELQVAAPIEMTQANILALIMPDEIHQSSYVQSFLAGAGAGIEVCDYEPSRHKVAGEYQGLLELRARELQELWGLE